MLPDVMQWEIQSTTNIDFLFKMFSLNHIMRKQIIPDCGIYKQMLWII